MINEFHVKIIKFLVQNDFFATRPDVMSLRERKATIREARTDLSLTIQRKLLKFSWPRPYHRPVDMDDGQFAAKGRMLALVVVGLAPGSDASLGL